MGTVPGLGAVGSVRGELAGARHRALRGPWNAKTKTPILLLSNRFDPATGYANALVAERRLGNAVLLTENGFGHLTVNDPSSCVLKWRIRYLVHLVTPPRGTVCAADKPPFP